MGRLGYIVDDERGDRTGADGGDGAGVVGAPPSTTPVRGPDELPSGTGTSSFTAFYADHYSDLVRLAALLSGSADTAPDLVQDCFVGLHGRWTAVQDPLPYARRSVVNACASHHRRVARGRRLPTPEVPDLELGADELEDALARLPARQRAAVVLRYYSDLPDADIARALRCRPGTVRSLIHRALKDLRARIEP